MKIDIAQDFSKFPAGRYRTDGPYSAEAFRDDLLVPALRSGEIVELALDGGVGYGSSFLEEVFGGLVHIYHLNPDELHKKIRLSTSRKSIELEVWQYIDSM